MNKVKPEIIMLVIGILGAALMVGVYGMHRLDEPSKSEVVAAPASVEHETMSSNLAAKPVKNQPAQVVPVTVAVETNSKVEVTNNTVAVNFQTFKLGFKDKK